MPTTFDAGRNAPARALHVRSDAIPIVQGRAILEPVRLAGREGVNSLFDYELLLKTTTAFIGANSTAELDRDSFLGRELSCSVSLDGMGRFIAGAVGGAPGHVGAGTREINALITHAAFAGQQGRHTLYRLTLRPWLHLATLSTDCKVFQNKTPIEVLDELLADYTFPVEKRLYGLEGARPRYYAPLDYCVQYNESDFEFFERLCQEWGISYHFEHAEGKHRLVLSDAMASFRPSPSAAYQAVEYHPPGWKVDAEYIHRFEPEHALTSGQYSTRDYDYTQPRADLSATRAQPRPTAQADGEVYQWHASQGGSHYAQPRAGASTEAGTASNTGEGSAHEQGRHLALLRMQALRTHGRRAQASGNLRAMVPGCTFHLTQHPQAQANVEYLILDTTFLVEDVDQASQRRADSAAASMDSTAPQHWRVQVDFTAHPVNETLRPALTRTKPHTHGPQTALVVGPAGQNIWTDELGRIKVQFPWDRLGQRNEHSSCWVRVSSPWAGNQLGGVHIPRIGQEVIVDFIGGDPDLPLCTGRVHNQLNLPPWRLPGQSALSGLRSRELTPNGGGNGAAGRSNQLVFVDTEGKIQAQLKSDHQHSELNLGYIGRIEGHTGRTQDRGEGVELRTDGHGSLRAAKGLHVSADGRQRAQGNLKDLDEPVQRLTRAREQHETLAQLAEHHHAQEPGEDQTKVSAQIKAQNEAIRGD
ncbi:MAG TPA: type VI secretion system tip protein TssI/VgrG, partial [Roseateles sp.]|nr:type VI secretion system tip protein TssI/VgrG [Roseateles sp.]